MLETRLLTDDELYELFTAEEDELIDAYLTDDLTATERQQFETVFLNVPERRTRLQLARAFHQHLQQTQIVEDPAPQKILPLPAQPWWKLWLKNPWVYATLLILATLSWGLWREFLLPPNVASFVISPIATRSQAQAITIPADADQIQFKLDLEKVESGPYQAVLRDGANHVVKSWSNLQPQEPNKQLFLDLPAKTAPTGDCQIILTRETAIVKEYSLHLTR